MHTQCVLKQPGNILLHSVLEFYFTAAMISSSICPQVELEIGRFYCDILTIQQTMHVARMMRRSAGMTAIKMITSVDNALDVCRLCKVEISSVRATYDYTT